MSMKSASSGPADRDGARLDRHRDNQVPRGERGCFGRAKQEKWLAMHYRSLNVPVSMGVGGTIDFLAGCLARAPQWMQRTGTEWIFRLAQEPRRLFKRYARDCWYFGGLSLAQWCRMQLGSNRRRRATLPAPVEGTGACQEICCPEWLDAEAVGRDSLVWERALVEKSHLLLDLEKVSFIDSTGVGLLIRLRKRSNLQDRHLVLVAPSAAVRRALQSMRLWPFFTKGPCTPSRRRVQKVHRARFLSGSAPAGVKVHCILAQLLRMVLVGLGMGSA
jgi:N-acetylglucosaminyldiphosphoundecaprenol N-acetyl-beta-D-mannosaminyltransferase